MTNNGLIGENTEFVLANDIDLSAYSTSEGLVPIGTPSKIFWANFDANGYVISNPQILPVKQTVLITELLCLEQLNW